MSSKIVVPELGESVLEATVGAWLKNEGERVSVGEPLIELETDKVDLEIGAPQDGILAQIEVQAGKDVRVGDVLGVVEDHSDENKESAPELTRETTPTGEDQKDDREQDKAEQVEQDKKKEDEDEEEVEQTQRFTPVARRFALEKDIDLADVKSSGPGKRVTKEDVERFIAQHEADHADQDEPEKKKEQPPAPNGDRQEEKIRLTRRRRTIARRLVEAQRTAAMLTTFNDVDMSAVIELRRKKRDTFQERHKVKLGFMSFFVKASIAALKEFPRVNAEIRGDDNEELVLKRYYDIGIAIGAEEGLVVPVLRDADQMSFAEIENKILEFVQKVDEKTLAIEDLRGGTFSITNGGVFGSLLSTPILNPPQTGILGLHRIEERPVAINGELSIKQMMYLALSYDHRVVDGREAVLFLGRIKALIEDPTNLLLEI